MVLEPWSSKAQPVAQFSEHNYSKGVLEPQSPVAQFSKHRKGLGAPEPNSSVFQDITTQEMPSSHRAM